MFLFFEVQLSSLCGISQSNFKVKFLLSFLLVQISAAVFLPADYMYLLSFFEDDTFLNLIFYAFYNLFIHWNIMYSLVTLCLVTGINGPMMSKHN